MWIGVAVNHMKRRGDMKLIIADDEDYTREGLASDIQWKNLGIDEVMQARDGKEALRIAKWFKPDIILTDIRMPKMDGIQFATDVALVLPKTRIIFMSGYVEIDYLKSAIQLSVVDYIEKPIRLENIIEAVNRAGEEVRQEEAKQQLVVDNQQLQSQKLANMLICKDNTRAVIIKKSNEVAFPVSGNYNVMLLRDREKALSRERSIREIASWFEEKGFDCLCNHLEDEDYILLLAHPIGQEIDMTRTMNSFVSIYSQFVIGVGFPVRDIMTLYMSFSAAKRALNYAYFDIETQVFEIDEHILKPSALDPRIYNEFAQVYTETPYNLKPWFDGLVHQLVMTKHYRKEQVNHLLKSFIMTIMDDNRELYEKEELTMKMEYASSIYEMRDIFNYVVELYIGKLDSMSKYSKLINDTIQYMREHYQDTSLSISQVAEYMRLSPTHINVLFKQEMAITIKQYLSKLRMDRAKELLEKEHYNISEVAQLSGYTNANYFAKVFREEMAMTPIAYRKLKNR